MTGVTAVDVNIGTVARAGIPQSLRWEPEILKNPEIIEDLGRLEPPAGCPDSVVHAKIPIWETNDIVKARRSGCFLAEDLGFSESRITLVATAISELARNILLYAGRGKIVLSWMDDGSRKGVVVTAIDRGPGIANLQNAMAGGFSTSGGLGLGLSGLNHIMDSFEINSRPGEGTQVVVGVFGI